MDNFNLRRDLWLAYKLGIKLSFFILILLMHMYVIGNSLYVNVVNDNDLQKDKLKTRIIMQMNTYNYN